MHKLRRVTQDHIVIRRSVYVQWYAIVKIALDVLALHDSDVLLTVVLDFSCLLSTVDMDASCVASEASINSLLFNRLDVEIIRRLLFQILIAMELGDQLARFFCDYSAIEGACSTIGRR